MFNAYPYFRGRLIIFRIFSRSEPCLDIASANRLPFTPNLLVYLLNAREQNRMSKYYKFKLEFIGAEAMTYINMNTA